MDGWMTLPAVCLLEERQLDLDEKPLVVQLNWNKDDREGRFVLKNENDVLPKVGALVLKTRRTSAFRTQTVLIILCPFIH